MLSEETFKELIDVVARSIELAGVGVILLGIIWATLHFGWQAVVNRGIFGQYHAYRSNLGRAILLGLELLVAADIILTVAIDPTVQSVLVLGLVVLIRTFLSYSLEVEIKGYWPWQEAKMNKQRKETP